MFEIEETEICVPQTCADKSEISDANLSALAKLGIGYRKYDGALKTVNEIITELIELINVGAAHNISRERLMSKRKRRELYFGTTEKEK